MKLHIGCGKRYIHGWTNLDINIFDSKLDIEDDAKTLKKIDDNSCSIIYSSHVLEHFGRKEIENVLNVWFKKLKPNGKLRLAVPDFDKVVERYLDKKDIKEISGFLLGGQRNEFDYHNMVFNKPLLTSMLIKVGFKEVYEWDWRNTDHSKYDDYSQSYLPHMEKTNGLLMSLNLEAKK